MDHINFCKYNQNSVEEIIEPFCNFICPAGLSLWGALGSNFFYILKFFNNILVSFWYLSYIIFINSITLARNNLRNLFSYLAHVKCSFYLQKFHLNKCKYTNAYYIVCCLLYRLVFCRLRHEIANFWDTDLKCSGSISVFYMS